LIKLSDIEFHRNLLGTELFLVDVQTLTDVMKLIASFWNFVNRPEMILSFPINGSTETMTAIS